MVKSLLPVKVTFVMSSLLYFLFRFAFPLPHEESHSRSGVKPDIREPWATWTCNLLRNSARWLMSQALSASIAVSELLSCTEAYPFKPYTLTELIAPMCTRPM